MNFKKGLNKIKGLASARTLTGKELVNYESMDSYTKELMTYYNDVNAGKQDKIDNRLVTDSKDVVSAINELKEKPSGEKVPIGSIVPFASDIIPLGYLLCDGREIQKKDYPELFALLKDKNGKRYLPDLRNQFIRGNSGDRELLSEQGDAIRNITGSITVDDESFASIKGVFFSNKETITGASGSGPAYKCYFDASKVVPTANENRPKNISVNFMIKAINVKQESIDELAIDELNKKIETNKVAINNHEYEVEQEFNRRDEVVTLWEGNQGSGTKVFSENLKNFKEIEIGYSNSSGNFKTTTRINVETIDFIDSGKLADYVLSFNISNLFTIIKFDSNGLTFVEECYNANVERIIGIGRVDNL